MAPPSVPLPSPADASVRLARATESEAVAGVQVRALAAYGDTVPPEIGELDAADAQAAWREAVVRPPTARHRVLVALSGATVVGFAATGPNEDPDAEPGVDGELLALHIDPERTRAGHGSRLLAAAVDTLRADGFRRAVTWVLVTDDLWRAFLESAGWGTDGAVRELALPGGAGRGAVRQVRLHTDVRDE